ncbi:MAG: TetR/AcrR family transcriptional regulator [Leptospiraceae bacterium]|nr:TetR/AcrR family transcriptional regulator [Leptospiraceae bacterium]
MNKRDQQRAESYSEILRVAEELITANGFENTSINQIASACGMTKGALYHHFESKEALLEKICQKHYDILRETARPFMEQKDLHWFARCGLILGAIRQANEERMPVASEYHKVRKNAGSGQFADRLAHYDKQFYIAVIAPILEEARELKEAVFGGSAETMAVFLYQLDRAMSEELAATLQGDFPTEVPAKARAIMETFAHCLAAMLGIPLTMVLELVNIPQTIAFVSQLVADQPPNSPA